MDYNNYTSAKKIFDFFIEKASEDKSSKAVFAQQYAHLKLLRYRIESLLNPLESYNLEIE